MNRTLSPYFNEALQLKNHLVMAPMTRNRAIDNLPNALMAEYYAQRSGAGLINALLVTLLVVVRVGPTAVRDYLGNRPGHHQLATMNDR